MTPEAMLANLTATAARHGLRAERAPEDGPVLRGEYLGLYRPRTRTATIAEHLEGVDALATALHELAHALLWNETGMHSEETAQGAGTAAGILLGLMPSTRLLWGTSKRNAGRPAVRAAKRLARWCRRGL